MQSLSCKLRCKRSPPPSKTSTFNPTYHPLFASPPMTKLMKQMKKKIEMRIFSLIILLPHSKITHPCT
ncbi:unnamed protein product [Brassica rapa]|uniref:Uncharacterized protein n=1 Tax=Brassica campestris TaxID=3711 RepID=A0A3P5Z8E2_BRACM|nr:unnamed protein product [Brassica rapa]VDC76112.1 unnamed protein product [Brassica rapa]